VQAQTHNGANMYIHRFMHIYKIQYMYVVQSMLHISSNFSYLNTAWSRCGWISEGPLYSQEYYGTTKTIWVKLSSITILCYHSDQDNGKPP